MIIIIFKSHFCALVIKADYWSIYGFGWLKTVFKSLSQLTGVHLFHYDRHLFAVCLTLADQLVGVRCNNDDFLHSGWSSLPILLFRKPSVPISFLRLGFIVHAPFFLSFLAHKLFKSRGHLLKTIVGELGLGICSQLVSVGFSFYQHNEPFLIFCS